MGKMQLIVLSSASKEKQQIRGSQQRARLQDRDVWELIQSWVMSLNCSFSGLDGIRDGYQPPKVQNWQTFWVCFKLRREEGDGKLLCNSNDPSCGSNIQSKAGDGVLKQKMKNKKSINKKCLYTKAMRMVNKQELEVIKS